jgi:hypothetical protein
MVMVTIPGQAKPFSMDGFLKSNLDIAKKNIRDDRDYIICVDGRERSGKSVRTMQMASYCDPSLTFERYAFTPAQFRKAVFSAEKYQAVVYDEAHSGLNSRAAMSIINRSLVSMLTMIGQKNLFVFVVLPTYFDLDRYVAIFRSSFLINTYFGKDGKRGFFSFYDYERKKNLYLLGQKMYNYRCVKPNFRGTFPNFYTLNETEYRKLKYSSFKRAEQGFADAETYHMMQELLFEKVMLAPPMLIPLQAKLYLLGMEERNFHRKAQAWRFEHPDNDPEYLLKSVFNISDIEQKGQTNISLSDSKTQPDPKTKEKDKEIGPVPNGAG